MSLKAPFPLKPFGDSLILRISPNWESVGAGGAGHSRSGGLKQQNAGGDQQLQVKTTAHVGLLCPSDFITDE